MSLFKKGDILYDTFVNRVYEVHKKPKGSQIPLRSLCLRSLFERGTYSFISDVQGLRLATDSDIETEISFQMFLEEEQQAEIKYNEAQLEFEEFYEYVKRVKYDKN